MKRIILLVINCLFFQFFLSAQINNNHHHSTFQQEKYSKLKIYLDGSQGQNIEKLAELGLDVEHGHYHRNEFFESDFSETEIGMIEAAGFVYDIVIDDVIDFYENQLSTTPSVTENGCGTNSKVNYQIPANWSLGSMGGYLTYQEMLNNLDSMASKYPNLISARQPIDANNLTHEGRPIYWLRISDNPNIDETEPEMLYDALHHAREPAGLSQLIFYMWYLLENYDTNDEVKYLVDNTEMYFVPCVNPDGYIYNELTNPNGGGLWRKNRRLNSTNDYGVDLNRNYSYNWAWNNVGSSPSSISNTYRGPSPFSEPETQNIRDFILAHQFKISLNYHTYSNVLIYPWSYENSYTPDAETFVAFSDVMTRENEYVTGTSAETIGYNLNGAADDWMYGDTVMKNMIISMTPEVGNSFWPSSSNIETLCTDNLYQNLAAAHLLLNYGELIDQSDRIVETTTGHFQYDVKKYGFENGDLTISFSPVSSNILTIGGAPVVYTLNQFQEMSDSVSYTLDANIQDDEEIVYIVSIDNGTWVKIDTIRKLYNTLSPLHSIYSNDISSMQNWTSTGGWYTTTSTFFSAPSSMADSPSGFYQANSTGKEVRSTPVDLTNATKATLTFWAKWDIEENYDYVQVLGKSGISGTYVPLCGLYTKPGGGFQALDEPLYDGLKSTWVQEEIDLTDFLGSNFYSKFWLVSDGAVQKDGFYFDDFSINATFPTGTETFVITDFIIEQNRPNPVRDFTTIQLKNIPNNAELVVYNLLGIEMYRSIVHDNLMKINTNDWNAGMYFYRVESTEGISESFKMEVVK